MKAVVQFCGMEVNTTVAEPEQQVSVLLFLIFFFFFLAVPFQRSPRWIICLHAGLSLLFLVNECCYVFLTTARIAVHHATHLTQQQKCSTNYFYKIDKQSQLKCLKKTPIKTQSIFIVCILLYPIHILYSISQTSSFAKFGPGQCFFVCLFTTNLLIYNLADSHYNS